DPITPVDPTPGPAESGNRPYYSDHAFRVAAGVASHGNRERCLSTRLHASIDALGRRQDSTRPMQVRASPAAGSIRPSKAPGARAGMVRVADKIRQPRTVRSTFEQ